MCKIEALNRNLSQYCQHYLCHQEGMNQSITSLIIATFHAALDEYNLSVCLIVTEAVTHDSLTH